MTAVTLATRAANLLAQAEDVLIFQGQAAVEDAQQHPLFRVRRYLYAPVLTNQAALANTLAITADRIKPLVPPGSTEQVRCPPLTVLLVSLGGNTMDLVVGMDVTTSFLQEDPDGRYRLRVWERFALRLKDVTARDVLATSCVLDAGTPCRHDGFRWDVYSESLRKWNC